MKVINVVDIDDKKEGINEKNRRKIYIFLVVKL